MTDTQATTVMTQLMAGFQLSQAVYVLAKLDVPTMIDEADGAVPVERLAEQAGAQVEPLRRLLRTLAATGVVTVAADGVMLTPVGATLSRHAPSSLRAVALLWMETHYLPFSELLHTVLTGEPAATRYFGKPSFEWMADDPDRWGLFSSAMAAVTTGMRAGMFDGYELPAGSLVVDVGGADGSVLVELIEDRADRRGVVFDLPPMIASARANLRSRGLTDRIDVLGGDFFDSVPTADIYLLSYILHDWADEPATRILRNLTRAGRPGARVLIIETVVPEGDGPHLSKMVDLTMLGMLTGKERTHAEYAKLCAGADLRLDRVVSTSTPFSIMEATIEPGSASRRGQSEMPP